MDRVITYIGQVPLETDILLSNKYSMVALAKLTSAVLGESLSVNGLAISPTSTPSLAVVVGPGEIYAASNTDDTAYSSVADDTSHTIVKQGLLSDPVTLNITPPVVSGQSRNYLVQARHLDIDTGTTLLKYFNPANHAQTLSGPGNSGSAQPTTRVSLCSVELKAGASAPTGGQTTPTPDAGYAPLYVVTVANGQTTITAPDIVTYAGAPFITERLRDKISLATGDGRYLKQSDASSTYLTISAASSTYLTTATAASTYLPIASKASQAEVDAGTNDTHYATPAKIRFGFISGTGYFGLPSWLGGYIFQWGRTSSFSENSGAQTITYPTPFLVGANVVIPIVVNPTGDQGTAWDFWCQMVSRSSLTSFQVLMQAPGGTAAGTSAVIDWFAIGR